MDDEVFKYLVSDFSDVDLPSFNLETTDNNTEADSSSLAQPIQVNQNLDDSEIVAFINSNKNANTTKKTKADLNVFRRWCHEVKEERDILDISVPDLDKILSHFFVKVKKADGSEYEPDTLSSYQRSIDRYIRENGKLYSILTDREFQTSRDSLEAKRKELRRAGKGRRPNKALGLTGDEVEKLWSEELLGCHSPLALLRTVWFNNTLHFGWRARDEHRKVQQGDLKLQKEEGETGREYVMWVTERGSKTRTGAKDTMPERYFNPRMYATNTDRCPVKMYKAYLERIPEAMKKPDSPFYLAYISNPKNSVWFKSSPLGINSLGNFMKSMAEKANLPGKHTNHSARRTMITTLRHGNVNPLDISQLSGHKNLKSIDSYSEASEEQQRRMSLTISGRSEGNTRAQPLQDMNNILNTSSLAQSSTTGTSNSAFSPAMLSGAVFNQCTITFNCPGALTCDVQQEPKRRRLADLENNNG